MSGDLHNAPPPVVVAGLVAVPMDIHQVVATLTFDAAAQVATAQATVTFTVGQTSGNPFFDLRQQITSAALDGTPIAPARLAHQDLGGGAGAKLRVIGTTLAAGSKHTLALNYTLGTPDAANARPIGWDAAVRTVSFDFWMTDLYAGRYLEMWLPANLIFDRFAVDLTVQIVGSPTTHVVWTNGSVTSLGSDHWHISYPETGTALSPMLVLLPVGQVQTRIGSVTLPGRPTPVAIELVKQTANPVNLATIEARLSGWLTDNVTTTGPYVHGDRFVAYLWDEPSRSMEYDGGTTSNAPSLQHETFHSWFGRGVKPASQADGWIDEAWTTYVTGGGIPQPFVAGDPPVQLCARNAYARVTASASYVDGARFFGGLAAALGEPALRAAMGAFYQEYRGRLVTTADLEAWLINRTGVLDIEHWFHRWVYGFSDPPTGALPDLALLDDVRDPGDDQFTGPVF